MQRARLRPYVSPTLVLLAFDWPDGGSRRDFLGFAIQRSPGYEGAEASWLPNRVGFDGPAPNGGPLPSNTSPIQKFLWWDARIDDIDRGKEFTYTVIPVVGTRRNLRPLDECGQSVTVTLPRPFEESQGVGTYFNRAVVSSQAFSREFGRDLDEAKLHRALAWLANGLHTAIPEFLEASESVEGAIYHLSDGEWVIPALASFEGDASLVYNKTAKDDSNRDAVDQLTRIKFHPRTRAAIMHNKFLVRLKDGEPVAVLTGSANFTTAGLSTQANVLHSFESPRLARIYLARKRLLQRNLSLAKTAAEVTGWSEPVEVGDAKVRVFFSPEARSQRESIDTIIEAVRNATTSVLFCLFMPTDKDLRNAVFEAGDQGRMMFGLINKISEGAVDEEPDDAAAEARIEIYHRSRRKRDVYAHYLFPRDKQPEGFWWESASLPGQSSKYPVYIHHKFVIIDAETDHPVIYTGSANMSKNALARNDENLLEIRNSRHLAAIYLAEFLRLYEHYRARAVWGRANHETWKTYRLRTDNRWARRAYTEGTPDYKSRIAMVNG